jgi:hypothetical protein
MSDNVMTGSYRCVPRSQAFRPARFLYASCYREDELLSQQSVTPAADDRFPILLVMLPSRHAPPADPGRFCELSLVPVSVIDNPVTGRSHLHFPHRLRVARGTGRRIRGGFKRSWDSVALAPANNVVRFGPSPSDSLAELSRRGAVGNSHSARFERDRC